MSDVDRLVRHAETLLDLGRPADAEQRYRDALALEPDSAAILTGLAVALSAQDRDDDARPVIERAAALAPESAEVAFLECEITSSLGDAQAAYAAAARCVQIAPELWQSHYATARALLAERRPRIRDAYDAARHAVPLDPHSAMAHSLVGACLAGLGNHAGAEIAFRHALALDPHNIMAQNNLAAIDIERGRLGRAGRVLRTAVGAAPQVEALHKNLDRVLLRVCLRVLWVLVGANLVLGLLLALHEPCSVRSTVGVGFAVGCVLLVRRLLSQLPGGVSQWGRGIFRRSEFLDRMLLLLDLILAVTFVLLAFMPQEVAAGGGLAITYAIRVVGIVCIVGWIGWAAINLVRGK